MKRHYKTILIAIGGILPLTALIEMMLLNGQWLNNKLSAKIEQSLKADFDVEKSNSIRSMAQHPLNAPDSTDRPTTQH